MMEISEMKITVKLFAMLRVGRFKEEEREYPDGTSCRQVIADLDLPEDQVRIVTVDGRVANLDQELIDGNVRALLPLVSGG